ncbi:unnamed protein product [Mycena citricolor]|uniref:alpha-1,2-Mannosidase n=1 Tax=Mycena citricolor TaxID=2018698 RepID=A0AAD2HZ96_9AGAR|nr:unnamed protein product [Mycena citricolor]
MVQSPYMRLQERERSRLLRIFRHRPYLYAAFACVSVVLVWQAKPHQYVSASFMSADVAYAEVSVLPSAVTHAVSESAPTSSSSSSPSLVHSTAPPAAAATPAADLHWTQRAQDVKAAFLHAYRGWEKYAAPHDELSPLTLAYKDPFNAWGVTAVDSLDTMLLMGLDAEYARAMPLVSNITFAMHPGLSASYFETVIRYLGGFLSAHALSRDRTLLDLAEQLAEQLDPVFERYDSPFPVYGINTEDGKLSGGEFGGLAEIGTLQVEYLYLAKATGNKRWYDRANGVIDALAKADVRKYGGMLPTTWNLTSGQPVECDDTDGRWTLHCPLQLSVGGMADSTHEYLLKEYLLTSKTDKASLDMYLRASTHILTSLLHVSPERNLLYMTDTSSTTHLHAAEPSHKLEHLSCFLPGLLALGAHTLPLDALAPRLHELGKDFGFASRGYDILSKQKSLKELHLWAAKGLAETCYMLYADQGSGLSPDEVMISIPWGEMEDGRWEAGKVRLWIDEVQEWRTSLATNQGTFKGRRFPPGVEENHQPAPETGPPGRDYLVRTAGYYLRPETVESLYILWRVTGETRWREMGWKIFQAIERESRTASGYASLQYTEKSPAPLLDEMPSYFLAETLKYLYLLFLDEDPLPLDQWVFNTEAHPLPVFRWTEKEKEKFGIP